MLIFRVARAATAAVAAIAFLGFCNASIVDPQIPKGRDNEDGVRLVRSLQQTFEPLQELRAVYGNRQCPNGFEPLMGKRIWPELEEQRIANLNAGTNGVSVKLCYKRGSSSSSNQAIKDVLFRSDPDALPACPAGWETVLEEYSKNPADLNHGAGVTWFWLWTVREYIVMCYKLQDITVNNVFEDGSSPLYHLRLVESTLMGVPDKVPREFDQVKIQNLNENVGLPGLYMAVSRSPSMLAAAVAFAGTGALEPLTTLPWAHAMEDVGTGEITVNIRLHCQKDGGPELPDNCVGRTDFRPEEQPFFEFLCQLTIKGIQDFWSGPLEIGGVSRQVNVLAENTSVEPNKDVDICRFDGPAPGMPASDRSPLLDMVMWYNTNFHNKTYREESWWPRTAAHELGHSILTSSYGWIHSAVHKGSSDVWSGWPEKPLYCPAISPDNPTTNVEPADVMKYYKDEYFSCFDWIITNWDRAKLIMAVDQYTYFD